MTVKNETTWEKVLLYKRSLSNGTVVTVCKDNSHDSADMDKLLRMLNFVEINSNHETVIFCLTYTLYSYSKVRFIV